MFQNVQGNIVNIKKKLPIYFSVSLQHWHLYYNCTYHLVPVDCAVNIYLIFITIF
jgi:hypothetical protein